MHIKGGFGSCLQNRNHTQSDTINRNLRGTLREVIPVYDKFFYTDPD